MENNKEYFNLGEYILNMRKEKGLSQRKFAQISGLSNTTISRIENGETLHPDVDTLKLLAKYLNIDEARLIKMSDPAKARMLPKRHVKINFLKQPVRRIQRYSSVFSASQEPAENIYEKADTVSEAVFTPIPPFKVPKADPLRKVNLKGMRLITLRLEKNITQKELADILGIDKTLISQYEGEIIKPEYEVVEKVAEFFGVTLEYLCGSSDIPCEEKTVHEETCKTAPSAAEPKSEALRPEYQSIALELQNENIDPADIRSIIDIFRKYNQKR